MIRHCEERTVRRGNPVFLSSGLPRRLRLLAMTGMALLLAGCILVDDFDTVWNEAKPDTCLSKIAESLYYSELRRNPQGKDINQLARGWTFNKQNFLLLKKEPTDKGGRLYRFNVVHGIFQRYRLNPTMREAFEKNYPNATVILKQDTVTIETLDAASRALLAEILTKPDYWEIEDQTMYNVYRNPECRFDDRKNEPVKESHAK